MVLFKIGDRSEPKPCYWSMPYIPFVAKFFEIIFKGTVRSIAYVNVYIRQKVTMLLTELASLVINHAEFKSET